jgi:hypothetical protein
MSSKAWPIVAAFAVLGACVVVPYLTRNPEAQAAGALIAASFPSVLKMIVDAMKGDAS